MKVGLDARSLAQPITGVGRYTMEMCRALTGQPGISLHLYSPGPIRADILGQLVPARYRSSVCSNRVLRPLWTETVLPAWASRDKLDVFWSPSHRLPRWLPGNMASVVTIHDLVWKYAAHTMRPLSRWLDQYHMPALLGAASRIVTVSQSTADTLMESLEFDTRRLSVVRPGARADKAKAMPADTLYRLGIHKPYVLFVGTLEPRKNLVRLLTAYADLPGPTRDKAMMVIAGGKGWGGIDLPGVIRNLNIRQDVRLLGYVEESLLSTLYTHARFLAMPSLFEGFGLPLAETIAHGTPVLTSDNSSMPEVAGDAGLLVNALDTGSISDGLKQMIENDLLRNRLASNAEAEAENFSWDLAARSLVNVFEDALADRCSLQIPG